MGSGKGRVAEKIASPRLLMGWRLIRANLGKLLGLSATGSVTALLWMLMQPEQFQSSALLEVEQAGHAGPGANDDTAALVAAQIIQTRSVLERASASLALQNYPASGADLLAELHIEQPGPSLVRVAYQAGTPQHAQQAVQAITQAYIQFNDAQQISAMEHSAELLLRKLDRLFDVGPLDREHSGFDQEFETRELPGSAPAAAVPGTLLKNVQNTARREVQPPLQNFTGNFGQIIEEAVVRSAVAGYEAGLQQVTRIGVIDPANLPTQALPRIQPGPLLLGYLLLLGLGSGFLLQRQWRRDSVALTDEAHGMLGLPVLALPEAEGGQGPQADPAFAEAMRTIRTLLCKDPEHEFNPDPETGHLARTLLVTSSRSGEGKSEVAEGLALSLGQVKRVLLVNTDLRGRDKGRFCQLPPEAPGLSHLIAGAAQLRDCIHTLKEEGIDVIPAGILPPNPQELLSSGRFRRLLDVLQRRYEFVVLAAPSLDAAADTLLLSRHCTDTLLVMRAGVTPVNAVETALEHLRVMGGPQPKVVLNRIDFGLARRYSFDRDLPAIADAYAYRKPGGSYLAAQG